MDEAPEVCCLLGLEHTPHPLILLPIFCFPTPSLPKLGYPETCSGNWLWTQRSAWLCLLGLKICTTTPELCFSSSRTCSVPGWPWTQICLALSPGFILPCLDLNLYGWDLAPRSLIQLNVLEDRVQLLFTSWSPFNILITTYFIFSVLSLLRVFKMLFDET